MTAKQATPMPIDIKQVLADDPGFLRPLVQGLVQEALEAEMTAVLGTAKGERTADRRGYRSGYYERGLVSQVGKLELRVPQDCEGRFSTELFDATSGPEKALAAALAEMYVQGVSTRRSRRSPMSCAATASRRRPSAGSTSACTPNSPASLPGRSTNPVHTSSWTPATRRCVKTA